jgi:hypothetical protein
VHSQEKKKTFKLYPDNPEGYPVEWWMMHLFSWEFPPFGNEFFVIHPLTSVVTVSQEKLNTLLHSTVLLPHSSNLRDMASPQKAVTNGLWEVISLPFCLLRQA